MLYIYYMETANGFQTTKIWKRTLKTLKQIAAATESSIVETVDRLASQEWGRVQAIERTSKMNTLITVRPADAGKLLHALQDEECEVIGSERGHDGTADYRDYEIQGAVSDKAKSEIADFALHTHYSDEQG